MFLAIHSLRTLLTCLQQGGGIAAAFTTQFPYLVEEKVVLIACAGLIETSDISRTAKFMSLPLIQTLASGGPVRVSFNINSPFLPLMVILIVYPFPTSRNISNVSRTQVRLNTPIHLRHRHRPSSQYPIKGIVLLQKCASFHSFLVLPCRRILIAITLLSYPDRPPAISPPYRV
jgi:hypothetical protein